MYERRRLDLLLCYNVFFFAMYLFAGSVSPCRNQWKTITWIESGDSNTTLAYTDGRDVWDEWLVTAATDAVSCAYFWR